MAARPSSLCSQGLPTVTHHAIWIDPTRQPHYDRKRWRSGCDLRRRATWNSSTPFLPLSFSYCGRHAQAHYVYGGLPRQWLVGGTQPTRNPPGSPTLIGTGGWRGWFLRPGRSDGLQHRVLRKSQNGAMTRIDLRTGRMLASGLVVYPGRAAPARETGPAAQPAASPSVSPDGQPQIRASSGCLCCGPGFWSRSGIAGSNVYRPHSQRAVRFYWNTPLVIHLTMRGFCT